MTSGLKPFILLGIGLVGVLVLVWLANSGLLFQILNETVLRPPPEKIAVTSEVPGFRLFLSERAKLEEIVSRRGLFTRGAIAPDTNTIMPIDSLSVALVGEEQPQIRSLAEGNRVLSSGSYQIVGKQLRIAIFIDPTLLAAQDKQLATYYFNRKLLEFLVAASPKITSPADQTAAVGPTSQTTPQEIDDLEREYFGTEPFTSRSLPVNILRE